MINVFSRFARGPVLVLLAFLAVVTLVVGTGTSGFAWGILQPRAIRAGAFVEHMHPYEQQLNSEGGQRQSQSKNFQEKPGIRQEKVEPLQ